MAFIVGDEYRTNGLSLKPGGSEVKVHYLSRDSRIYDKIKNTKKYITSLLKITSSSDIIQIDVDGQPFWKAEGVQGKLF